MFRRLFISLLILSALTSDGTVNIAGYLINLRLHDGMDLDLIILDIDERGKDVLEDIQDSDLISFGDCRLTCFEGSEDDGKNASSKFFCREYNYNIYLYIPSFQGIGVKNSNSCVSKDISLHMSDLSPPCI